MLIATCGSKSTEINSNDKKNWTKCTSISGKSRLSCRDEHILNANH